MNWLFWILMTFGWATPCPGDVNGDRVVNILDASIIASNLWQTVAPGTNGDLNGDGVVDLDDLQIVRDNYGNICRYRVWVPEVAVE